MAIQDPLLEGVVFDACGAFAFAVPCRRIWDGASCGGQEGGLSVLIHMSSLERQPPNMRIPTETPYHLADYGILITTTKEAVV
jgi:hypothetical protein